MLESFDECFEDVRGVIKFRNDDLPMKIYNLVKQNGIEKAVQSMRRYFSNNLDWAFRLADHFDRENQVYAV